VAQAVTSPSNSRRFIFSLFRAAAACSIDKVSFFCPFGRTSPFACRRAFARQLGHACGLLPVVTRCRLRRRHRNQISLAGSRRYRSRRFLHSKPSEAPAADRCDEQNRDRGDGDNGRPGVEHLSRRAHRVTKDERGGEQPGGAKQERERAATEPSAITRLSCLRSITWRSLRREFTIAFCE
jgi:hypothetical protein